MAKLPSEGLELFFFLLSEKCCTTQHHQCITGVAEVHPFPVQCEIGILNVYFIFISFGETIHKICIFIFLAKPKVKIECVLFILHVHYIGS